MFEKNKKRKRARKVLPVSEEVKEKAEKNIREGIFTYGITVHDGMPSFLFEKSIDSVLESYKEMKEKNIPIDIMISIDATSEEDFRKELENKDLDKLSQIYNKDVEKKIYDEVEYLESLKEEEDLDEEKIKRLEILKESKENCEKVRNLCKEYKKQKKTADDTELNKLKQKIIDIHLKEFRKNREEKRKYIEKIKKQIEESKEQTDNNKKLNINLNVIESTEKYGKVSASRNRIIDLCKTKYLTFLDGDDKIQAEALQRFINECRNNELGNPEGRKNYRNSEEAITGEADVIYLEKRSGKSPCSNIYNVQALRDKGIRFTKQIGSEDGYFKAAILQNNLKIVYAADENLGIVSNYEASNSTIAMNDKFFEPIIQLTNHLARHNKNGMQIWDEDFVRNRNIPIDPNNIFHYFDASYECNGYGSFFGTKKNSRQLSKIHFAMTYYKNMEVFSAIISSLILYPEVLVEGEDRNYFLEVRRKLREEIEENGNTNINILEILEKTKGYNEVFEKMKNNFADKDEFIKYFKEIGNYLDINNFEKRKIFNDVLLDLDIDKETNQLIKIKNPHLTGDASKIPEITDFDQYLSIEELKKKPENEQIRIMNKMLKGKFLPEDLPIEDKNIISKQNSIIQYMSNYYKENIPFILDVIAKTDSYRNDLIIRTLVNRNFNIEKTLGEIDFKPGRVLEEMDNCSKSIADYKTEHTEENSLKIHDNFESLLNVLSDDKLEILFFNDVDSLLIKSKSRKRIINLKEFHETVKSLKELKEDPKIKELLSGEFDVVFSKNRNFFSKFNKFKENLENQVNEPIKILEEIDSEFTELRQTFRGNYKENDNQILNQEQNNSFLRKIGAFFTKIFSSFFKGNNKTDTPTYSDNKGNFIDATNTNRSQQNEFTNSRIKEINKTKTNEIDETKIRKV